MKQITLLIMLMCCVFLSSCADIGDSLIVGADNPIEIYVKGQFGEQYEKRPIKMINIDGVLYFDTGIVSDMSFRCGTMDRLLKKTVNENEIPKNSGEANFDAEGCQNATNITKEVNIDGKWIIFKKYDTYGRIFDDLKYCHYIKGRLNNAAADSEVVVLSTNEDVTFNDVYEPYLSSQFIPNEDSGRVHHNRIYNDKWGVMLYANKVTKKGLTLRIEQFGGNPTGELSTGEWFKLEKTTDDGWQEVQTNPLIDFAWNSIAYKINKNDITTIDVEWEWLYGELKPGYYRLSKEVMDFRASGDFDKEIYQVHFTIE